MKRNAKRRTLPRRPIVPPPQPVVGQFIVSSIVMEEDRWSGLKSVRVELVSHGPIEFNRFPRNSVDLVERASS